MAMQSKEFIKISVVYKNLLSWVRIKRDFVFTDHIIKFTITSKDWYHVHLYWYIIHSAIQYSFYF